MDKLKEPLNVFFVKVIQSVLLVFPVGLLLGLFIPKLHLTDVRNLNQCDYEALVVKFFLAWRSICRFQVSLYGLAALGHFFHLFDLTGVNIHELL